MNKEIFMALDMLEKEKGIPKDYMLEKISQALLAAYKKDTDGPTDNVVIEPDEKKQALRMYAKKVVVDMVEDPFTEISYPDALTYSKRATVGDIINVDIKTMAFGRIAAQTAKQVIVQGIREAEQGIIYERFTSTERELIPAVISRIDPKNGNMILEVGGKSDRTEVLLPAGEQIKTEELHEGDHIRVYVVEVRNEKGRPRILISRTHPGLVKRLFELQVPEIRDGLVEIRNIAREAGSRTKIAVSAQDPEIDPIGACIGPSGERVNAIISELHGEKIDVVKYSDNPEEFIAAALEPASVIRVDASHDLKVCRVIVPDDQLSLAIGKEGQNARLAVKLTGYKIDIKPLSGENRE